MNVVKATQSFESWLAQRIRIEKKDLRHKHECMKAELFPFFRATYYRWAQLWPEVCSTLASAPQVLAVGDLHVENFGTWRDIEGRLIWGVNDFDEAWPMAYTIDLIRLAVSAHLAVEAGNLPLKREDICDRVLAGYRESMKDGGQPFVLGDRHRWLRLIAEGELRDPVRFWKKMDSLPTLKTAIPISASDAVTHLMPAPGIKFRVAHRVAGLGSLGHARYVALGDWCGGRIAREAKALVPSSACWAESLKADEDRGPAEILYQTIINRAIRCLDPFVQVRGRWIVRRLGPYCSRVELASLRGPDTELRLLYSMGWETANIHLGTPSARKAILRHLGQQKEKWLHHAAEDMLKIVREDWNVWRKKGYL
jgi:Uncharacterized protein conserved in bacteria (DUF2252)